MWNLRMLPVLTFLTFAGCTDNGIEHGMENQPKVKPMAESDFFPDGRGARPQVLGTIARGHLQNDALLYTGKIHGRYGEVFPFAVTREVLERGHERYDIFCAVCHDRVGTGNGMIVRRGFSHPPSYHTDRLRKAPVGHYFDVITNGYGSMYSYDDRIPANDRWAIIAYIRALQLSQHAVLADLSGQEEIDLGIKR